LTRFQINPGEFRHVIQFQEQSEEQNSYGENNDNWVDVMKTRAGIYPMSGKEFFAAETVSSEVSHKVNMRYLPGITPDMRILFGDRIFSIISVINFQEKNIELQLLCKEVI
jgi:SPP1 family predicted phage head-tail adaptor